MGRRTGDGLMRDKCLAQAKDANGHTHWCGRAAFHSGPHKSPNRTARGDWCGIIWLRDGPRRLPDVK
jgi:hypothetical protein